jgi:hypothetical protein
VKWPQLAYETDSEEKNAARLLQAGEDHLAGPDEVDVVVIGIPPKFNLLDDVVGS